jgi:pimeloyl-ACP methyl ester carboxylesterase
MLGQACRLVDTQRSSTDHESARRRARTLRPCGLYRLILLFLLLSSLLLSSLVMAGCGQEPTPAPLPTPTIPPTPTPAPAQVLESTHYSISLDNGSERRLLAFEEIQVGAVEGQLLVFSEVTWLPTWAAGGHTIIERRSVVLSPNLDPIRYDVERSALGVRSVWVGERDGQAFNVLNNNLDWHAPVLTPGISPAPEVLLEDSPSALPFALLALRYTMSGEGSIEAARRAPQSLQVVNVLADLADSQRLTLSVDALRQSGVIGTTALDGHIEGALNPSFTFFVRPASRALHSVQIEDYRFNLWLALRDPRLREPGELIIQRLAQRPEIPRLPPAGEATRVDVTFTGARNTELAGTLVLPAGEGPFPALLLHSQDGVAPRWDPGDVFAERGWAVFSYDKRGLGSSRGEFERGPLDLLAEDAVAAAQMLRQRPEIDPQRIVFVGLGEGGRIGALATPTTDAWAAAILGGAAHDAPLFPGLARMQVEGALATHYGWESSEVQRYIALSINQWQQWLFEQQDEVSLLGRRTGLRALRTKADVDLVSALRDRQRPVLLLHGSDDRWTPQAGARTLADTAGIGVEGKPAEDGSLLWVFEGLGADLGASDNPAASVWAPDVDEAVFTWLERVLLP